MEYAKGLINLFHLIIATSNILIELDMYTPDEIMKIGVKTNQISQFIYKYKSPDYLFELLRNNELWFSSPSSFNDPFDCQINLDTNNTIDEIDAYLAPDPRATPEMRRKIAVEMFNSKDKWDNLMNTVARKSINSHGVCCFSGNQSNILLWAHYANSHKGVCLKFDVLEDTNLFYFPVKVNYTKDYPIYNHLRDRDQIVNSLMLTKSPIWSYEEELRIIKLNTFGPMLFNRSALVEITFGCKCEEVFIRKAISLCEELGYKIVFKKATINKSKFELDFSILE